MEKTPQIRKFYDPLKTNKHETFCNMNKKKQVQTINYFESRQVVVRKDHSYCTRTKLPGGYHPLTPSWTTSLDIVSSKWHSENKFSSASLLQKTIYRFLRKSL